MLKRVLTFLCMAVLAAAVAIAQTPPPADAQAPAPGQQQKPAYPDKPTTESDKPGGRTVTLTGCLQQATEGGEFILTNVTAGAKGTAGTPMPGEPSAPAAAPTASTYRLVGTGGQDLTKHVGHKVEVIGSIAGRLTEPKGTAGAAPTEPGTPPTTTPPPTTPPSPAASPMAGGKGEPRLNVKSFKHVAPTCP